MSSAQIMALQRLGLQYPLPFTAYLFGEAHAMHNGDMHIIGKNRSVLLLMALASAGLAQDTGPLKLTLRDAVALALKQNPR